MEAQNHCRICVEAQESEQLKILETFLQQKKCYVKKELYEEIKSVLPLKLKKIYITIMI